MGKKMRLPNGYGTIYKLSGNRRNPFVVAVTNGWDRKGNQVRKIIGYTDSREKGLQLLADYHKNPYDLNYRTLKFSDVWIEVEKELEKLVNEKKMSKSNLTGLSLVYKNHCKPLYNDKLLELKRKKMQLVMDSTDLGYTTKGYIKTVCKKIFDYAINEYELPIYPNPADKLNCGEKNKIAKHFIYDDKEIEILFNNQDNEIVKTILIHICTGLRPNELFVTKLENIHLSENYMITGSKTEAGKNRIIPLHPKIKPIIKYFYDKGTEYPFTTIINEFNYGKYVRQFNQIIKDLNINTEHTPYDARHTFITKMKKANVNEYILKRIVGHSIDDLTEKVYTHRDIEELLNEVRKAVF